MSNIRIALLAAAATFAPTAAQAELKVFKFSGTINSSYDPQLPMPTDFYKGAAITGQFSYDTDAKPTTNGIQDIYNNAVTITFNSAQGTSSGTGYINVLHYSYGDDINMAAFPTGDYYLVNLSPPQQAATAIGSPLRTDWSGVTFSLGAEGFVRPGSDLRRSFGALVTVDPAEASLPEPASWALMIGGFGAVGGTMRRRRIRTGVRFA